MEMEKNRREEGRMQEGRREKGLREGRGEKGGGPAWGGALSVSDPGRFNPWQLADPSPNFRSVVNTWRLRYKDISHMYFLQTCKIII